jgi:hypothetical protein
MNGTVEQDKTSSDLANATVSALEPTSHQENQRPSSALIEIRPRHKKKDPSHFGPVEEAGTLVESLDGEKWGPLLFLWI